MAHQGVPLEEARGLGVVGETLEPGPQAVALLHRRRELPAPGPLREEVLPGRLRVERPARHRREVPLVEERPGEPAERRALAPAVALERDAAVEGVEEHVVPAHEPLAQPLLPRLREEARPPRPRRPCGSRAGRRTRAAAPGGPGRRGRGWSRRSPARGRRARARPAPARPSGSRASVRARSSLSRRRSFIVVAAFSVKVTAAISSSRAAPARTIASMRSTRRVVFPVPAPASRTRLVRWSRRARSRASSSTGRKRLT